SPPALPPSTDWRPRPYLRTTSRQRSSPTRGPSWRRTKQRRACVSCFSSYSPLPRRRSACRRSAFASGWRNRGGRRARIFDEEHLEVDFVRRERVSVIGCSSRCRENDHREGRLRKPTSVLVQELDDGRRHDHYLEEARRPTALRVVRRTEPSA